jgi:hypothetical protein
MQNDFPDVTHVVPQDGSTPYYQVNGVSGFEAKLPAACYSIETVMDLVRLIDQANHSANPHEFRITSIPARECRGGRTGSPKSRALRIVLPPV